MWSSRNSLTDGSGSGLWNRGLNFSEWAARVPCEFATPVIARCALLEIKDSFSRTISSNYIWSEYGLWNVYDWHVTLGNKRQPIRATQKEEEFVYQFVYPLEYLVAGESGTFKNKTLWASITSWMHFPRIPIYRSEPNKSMASNLLASDLILLLTVRRVREIFDDFAWATNFLPLHDAVRLPL